MVKNENNHYHWYTIQRRHFIKTAKAANYSMERAEEILDEMLSKVDDVIEELSAKLPDTFPKQISRSIFDGMRSMKEQLAK